EEGDVRGAVRLAVSSDTLAPYDDATAATLRQLHPPRATPTSSFPPSPPPDGVGSSFAALTLTDSDIAASIKSFPAGSAGGLDGMRPQHLKDMTSAFTGVVGQQLIASLTEFANLCLAGRVPATVRPVL